MGKVIAELFRSFQEFSEFFPQGFPLKAQVRQLKKNSEKETKKNKTTHLARC